MDIPTAQSIKAKKSSRTYFTQENKYYAFQEKNREIQNRESRIWK